MKFEDLNLHQLSVCMNQLQKRIDQANCQLLFGEYKDDIYAQEQIEKALDDMCIVTERYVELTLIKIDQAIVDGDNA